MTEQIKRQMPKITRLSILIGGLYLFLGIMLGAFAAHGLKDTLTVYRLDTLQTGVKYQLIHGVALLSLGALNTLFPRRLLSTAIISIIIGVFLFSFSLYAIALFGSTYLGIITPIGGIFMMLGWVLTMSSVLKE